jgi:hypothetical protein
MFVIAPERRFRRRYFLYQWSADSHHRHCARRALALALVIEWIAGGRRRPPVLSLQRFDG